MVTRIEINITTLAPLAHGSFGRSIGNAVALRREPIVSLPVRPRVPVISGNSIRGQVRRLIMRDLFRRAGLGVGELPDRQWDMLYGGLANGGHLTGKEKSPTPAVLRELREQIPPLSVLGSALYHFMIPGRCRFGFAWPVCRETKIAELVHVEESDLPQAGDIVTETSQVRHIERDQQDPEETGVTPMPVTIEAIATGTRLQCEVSLFAEATEIEAGCIAYGLSQVGGLGGKCGAGFGAVSLEHNGNPAPYIAWLESIGADALRTRLTALAETL